MALDVGVLLRRVRRRVGELRPQARREFKEVRGDESRALIKATDAWLIAMVEPSLAPMIAVNFAQAEAATSAVMWCAGHDWPHPLPALRRPQNVVKPSHIHSVCV